MVKKNKLNIVKLFKLEMIYFSSFACIILAGVAVAKTEPSFEMVASKMSGDFIVDRQKSNSDECADFSLKKDNILNAFTLQKRLYLNNTAREPSVWLFEFKLSESINNCRTEGRSNFISKRFDSEIDLKIKEKVRSICTNSIFSGSHEKVVEIRVNEIYYEIMRSDSSVDKAKSVCVWVRKGNPLGTSSR